MRLHRPLDKGKPHCSFSLPPAGHADTPGSQTVVAVFRTRNSPVFELLPWCVAPGLGLVSIPAIPRGVVGKSRSTSERRDAAILGSRFRQCRCFTPQSVAFWPHRSVIRLKTLSFGIALAWCIPAGPKHLLLTSSYAASTAFCQCPEVVP